ncbi:hypothetical protein LAG90_05955 [Marinilongibacter aquaticus]|uniref:hypothetical protein n=1 Tax=Marinilongibacter aquaticus TaxID=2975157 RepID=UPI0021BD7738|nr:hypothetical protein [Marinilongibacter aquaticus]UBM60185.1 hypothetical protein LAG90_05955 [Marinilongibacter aquaticus]
MKTIKKFCLLFFLGFLASSCSGVEKGKMERPVPLDTDTITQSIEFEELYRRFYRFRFEGMKTQESGVGC